MKLASGVLVTVLAGASGCAFTFQDHLPVGHPPATAADAGKCSTSTSWARADYVLLGGDIATAAVAEAVNENRLWHARGDVSRTVFGLALLAGMLHLASAGNGYHWAAECRQIQPSVAAR